ncbi:hypothetical protein [Eikenella sp. NML03-A-027]|uniref:hypothetical protein n=1 Tax=Eikenella sp. NML03-A-027 TaxID=1795828 RepID=UPI0012E8B832|nr:hypothetical protein [Eikenella sp. NML03-A-027]
MMWMPLLSKLLPAGSLWKKLLPLLLALAVAATCYRAGYLNRDGKAKTEMAAVAAAHQQAQLEAERAYSAKLAEVSAEKQKWHDFSQQQSAKLAETTRQLDTQTTRIKQEIANAVKNDQSSGRCYSGLGAGSLQLYKQALGYSAD